MDEICCMYWGKEKENMHGFGGKPEDLGVDGLNAVQGNRMGVLALDSPA